MNRSIFFRPRESLLWFLATLVLLDVAFVALTGLRFLGFVEDHRFSIHRDGGYAEFFQYGKEVLCAVLLARLASRWHAWLPALVAVIMAYLFLDDALQWHETIGQAVSDRLSTDGPLGDAYHIGQFAYACVLGSVAGAAIAAAWFHSEPFVRRAMGPLLACLLAFFACAALLDVAHELFLTHLNLTSRLADLAEEVGEHLSLSVALWWCFVMSKMSRPAPEPETTQESAASVALEAGFTQPPSRPTDQTPSEHCKATDWSCLY